MQIEDVPSGPAVGRGPQRWRRPQPSRRYLRLVGGSALAPAVITGMVVAIAGCSVLGSTFPGSPSAFETAVTHSQAPTAVWSPSLSEWPRPLAAGQSWGGLVWDQPVVAELPWAGVPDQLISWKGRYVGLDVGGKNNAGGVVVAGSADLVHWTTLASGAGSPFQDGLSGGQASLLVGPAGLVAIGPYGACDGQCPTAQVWSSVDGAVWTKHDKVPFGAHVAAAAAGVKGIVVLTSQGLANGDAMWFSATGDTWKSVDLSGAAFRDGGVADVCATSGGFVAVGGTGLVAPPPNVIGDTRGRPAAWWSEDGSTWIKAAVQDGVHDAAPFTGVAAWPYGLILQQSNWGQWMSEDGRSWKPVPEGGMYQWGGWANDIRAVAVVDGDRNAGTPDQLWTWTKGLGWKELSQASFPAPWEWYRGFVTQDGVIALARLSGSDEWGHVTVLSGHATP